MALSEPASHGGNSRFGQLSSNMFFIRNTAKPKRVRHIEGLNGALICNVNDDPALIRSAASSSLTFHRNNLPTFETPRRVERLVPPMGFWNTHGVIHDTERWKQELASLASASGLGIEKDDQKHLNKPTATANDQHASRSGAYYSTRTGRFNEGAGKSRGRTTSKHNTAHTEMLFRVPENEREMWMLQVLCQLLGTSNLEDVQSWLISATVTEKDQARTMINSALRGLKESERASAQVQQSVDLNSLSNFVERQKHEEKFASKKYVDDTLSRSVPALPSIDEENQTDGNYPAETTGDDHSVSNVSLQSITTYKHAFPNYYEGAYRSLGRSSAQEHQQSIKEHDENIETIHLDDDRHQPHSSSGVKAKKITTKASTPNAEQSKHLVESFQFNDDDSKANVQRHDESTNTSEEVETIHLIDRPARGNFAKSTKPQPDAQSRGRKIRELQQKLSRQEEESKKLFDELQSKQSRLENAIKLLVKQTSAYGKRHQPTREDHESEKDDSDAPVINLIIQSPRESQRPQKPTKSHSNGSNIQKSKSLNIPNPSNGHKHGENESQDVKVQISLSRLDSRSPRVFTGVWKPDASTLQRLQGN